MVDKRAREGETEVPFAHRTRGKEWLSRWRKRLGESPEMGTSGWQEGWRVGHAKPGRGLNVQVMACSTALFLAQIMSSDKRSGSGSSPRDFHRRG